MELCERHKQKRKYDSILHNALHGRGGQGRGRIAIIDHGKIIATGTSAELKSRTNSETLEDAFLELTGHKIREEEASSLDRVEKDGTNVERKKKMNVIYIMWLRQIKKYFRSRSRIIGSLGQPLLFLLAFGFGFGSIYKKAGEGNYMQFLAPGIILMSVLFTAIFSGIDLIWDRQFGFLKETMVAPVSRLQIMLGKTLGGATVATVQGIIVFVLTLLVGFHPQNVFMLPVALIVVFLVALLFTSLGIGLASTMEDMQGFQLIINFLVMPIFFLSGALFPLEGVTESSGRNRDDRSAELRRRRFAILISLLDDDIRHGNGHDRSGCTYRGSPWRWKLPVRKDPGVIHWR